VAIFAATHFFMQLVVDLGNTNQKCAIFSGDELLHLSVEKTISIETLSSLINEFGCTHAILSSVINHDIAITHYLQQKLHLIFFDENTPIPIKNAYATPHTLGKDRLAGAVGARKLFPGNHVLVIDAGTCLKYDLIHADGIYLGGAISPGLQMRFGALHNYTAHLPLLDITMLQNSQLPLTGNSTDASLLSGVGNGALFEVNGVIKQYTKQYYGLQVVLTGGDAFFFEKRLESKIFAAPNLVLYGLHIILEHHLNNT
jgi:type III pantothenate kinase